MTGKSLGEKEGPPEKGASSPRPPPLEFSSPTTLPDKNMARMFNIDPRQQAQRQYEVLVTKYYVERIEALGSSIESVCHGATGGFLPRLKQVIERPGDKWRQHLLGHLRGLLGAIGAKMVKEANSPEVTLKNWPQGLAEEAKDACVHVDLHFSKVGNDGEPSFDVLMKILAYFSIIMEAVEESEVEFHRSQHSGGGRQPRRENKPAEHSTLPGRPAQKGPRSAQKGPRDPAKPRKNLKTELCRQVQNGTCSYGQKCKYAHSEAERLAALGPAAVTSPKREAQAVQVVPEPTVIQPSLPTAVNNSLPSLPTAVNNGLAGLPGLPTLPPAAGSAPTLNLPGFPNGFAGLTYGLPASLPQGPVVPLNIPMAQPQAFPTQ